MAIDELIIGANGYLGQYLAASRRERNCLLHARTRANAICAGTGLPFLQEDLVESRQALASVEPRTVYLIARPVTQEAGAYLDFAQNVQWLLQEWADKKCLERVVFASTQLVYATPADERPIPTNSALGPETAYDCHKAEMEFFLALLAHHRTPVKVEVYRLPLLAGREPVAGQARAQFFYEWRADYLAGKRWLFPADDPRHMTWGNSWVHVDDVVELMTTPRQIEGQKGARYSIVQPVSGHASYYALDAFFRERYELPPMLGSIHLSKHAFYLQDNAGCRQRGLEEAFGEVKVAEAAR